MSGWGQARDRWQGAASLARRAVRLSPAEITQRAAVRLYRRTGADLLTFPLLTGDVADSTALALALPAVRPDRATPLTIGWLTVPPSPGSGGHTTMFRMVRALEAAGHRCVLYLYDRHGGDLERHTRIVREGWGDIAAEVRDVADGLVGLDACVATSWQTAHVLAARGAAPMRRLYFVQDYEPFFYPRGSEYSLAEDTYRFGFRRIALGEMVGGLMEALDGDRPDVVPFGLDTSVYGVPPTSPPRSGVIFYGKPDVPRRGYVLGLLALEEFHRRHPDQEIHVYGEFVRELTMPVTLHDRMTTSELNALYNRTIAGFGLSFTNISLVAEEMLAGGVIPVVNDSPYARADLDNPYVSWAQPTPGALADALSRAVERVDRDAYARLAAASVRGRSWAPAQAGVLRIVEDEVYGPAAGPADDAAGGPA